MPMVTFFPVTCLRCLRTAASCVQSSPALSWEGARSGQAAWGQGRQGWGVMRGCAVGYGGVAAGWVCIIERPTPRPAGAGAPRGRGNPARVADTPNGRGNRALASSTPMSFGVTLAASWTVVAARLFGPAAALPLAGLFCGRRGEAVERSQGPKPANSVLKDRQRGAPPSQSAARASRRQRARPAKRRLK